MRLFTPVHSGPERVSWGKQGDMGAYCRKQSLDETRQGTATRITDTYRDLYRRLSQGREGGTIKKQDTAAKVGGGDRPGVRCPNRLGALRNLERHRGEEAHVVVLVS